MRLYKRQVQPMRCSDTKPFIPITLEDYDKWYDEESVTMQMIVDWERMLKKDEILDFNERFVLCIEK